MEKQETTQDASAINVELGSESTGIETLAPFLKSLGEPPSIEIEIFHLSMFNLKMVPRLGMVDQIIEDAGWRPCPESHCSRHPPERGQSSAETYLDHD